MQPVILVVDDQADLRLSARLVLNNYQYDVVEASSPVEALELLTQDQRIDLVLLDMNYSSDTTSGAEGLWFLKKLQSLNVNLPVVTMTAWASIELAVEAMQLGARDFIEKPWKNQRLIQIIKQQLELNDLKVENLKLKQQQKDKEPSENLVWHSPAMVDVMNKITRLARSDATILLTGENGTGKSSIAQYIHQHSSRADKAFISVNMGAIPESLFESEMFGHNKGAFTDAKEQRIGRFELADGGTLFLDEIGNIPLSQQGKLLRVLEDGYFEKVGASRSQKADVRLICATNADLGKLIEQGLFRADLYFRINTLQANIPPLIQRQDDILPLANQFLSFFANKYSCGKLQLSDSAIKRLKQYAWPGNVRELGHIIERAVLLADHSLLNESDIDFGSISTLSQVSSPQESTEQQIIPLQEAERKLVQKALEYYDGNVQDAAKALGINDSALYRRIDKFQISKTYVSTK
jgi:DNA-binding NtrC family response regulator